MGFKASLVYRWLGLVLVPVVSCLEDYILLTAGVLVCFHWILLPYTIDIFVIPYNIAIGVVWIEYEYSFNFPFW